MRGPRRGKAVPMFGAASGRFLGWWYPEDLVWRDETGRAVGYLEEAYGPWCDEDGFDWRQERQEYALYRFEGDGPDSGILAYGDVLSGVPDQFGLEWAGRFGFSQHGLGRRAVPPPEALAPRPVPPRPADRVGRAVGDLRDPEDCTYRGR